MFTNSISSSSRILFLGNDSKTSLKTKEQLRLLEYNQVKADEEKIDGTEYVTFDAFFFA